MPGLTLEPLGSYQAGDYIQELAWSGQGQSLAVAEIGGPVHLLDGQGGCRQRWSGHASGTTSLAWQPGGDKLASCGLDGQVCLWQEDLGEAALRSPGPDRWLNRVNWQCKGQQLAVVGGRYLRVYSNQGEQLLTSQAYESSLVDLQWLPHEELCITAGYLGLQAWRSNRQEPLRRYRWQGSTICLSVSPNQRYIATGDQDRTVHFWRTKKPAQEESAMMSGFAIKVQQLSWRSDSRYLATGGSSDVCLWDCLEPGPEGRPPRIFSGNPDAFVTALAFEPKGPLLASANEHGELSLWMAEQPAKPLCRQKYDTEISRLAWSPDGKRLALGLADGEVTIVGVTR